MAPAMFTTKHHWPGLHSDTLKEFLAFLYNNKSSILVLEVSEGWEISLKSNTSQAT